jgi:Caspase domain
MTQMVQAKCPHCQNVLRFPAEWVSKAMRCKYCKKSFQAKANSSKSANVPVAAPASSAKKSAPIPTGQPANAAPAAVAAGSPPASSGNPLGFEQDEPAAPASAAGAVRRGKGRGLLLLVVMFFFLFVLGAGGAGFVLYKALTIRPDYLAADGRTDRNKPRNSADKDNDTPGKKTPPVFSIDEFPRRALLISVNNYLFYNTVHYGSEVNELVQGYPGSSTKVLRDRFTRPPMNFPATQVIELSDGILPADKAHSTQKSVIETTIKEFVDSSRPQDRIVVFFAGHAASLEDKSYLVPIDGNLRDAESLLPLKWVYDQLANCKAQQKILVLDVFRYSPSRGFELPSTGEGDEGTMPDGFDKDVLNPPAGVQVWCSCQKEQSAVELEGGSAFMQALCNSLQGGAQMKGLSAPTQPIPVEERVKDVNERLKLLLAPEKRTQISRLTGTAPAVAVAYNKDEPPPLQVSPKEPKVAGGDAAPIAHVNSILDFFKELPAVRETRTGDRNVLNARFLPVFGAKKLASYKPDGYKDTAELQKRYTKTKEEFAKEFPLRAAVFDALESLQASNKIKMFEVQRSPVTQERKNNVRKEQELLGMSTFNLEKALADLKAAGEERDKETSRRWQANFDYTRARLQSRLVYLIEYNYVLSRVRADDLPELAPGQTGWRVGTGKKIAVNEAKAKDFAKDTKKLWDRIMNQYPDTPWSLLAQREKEISLGLQWRPMSD